MIRIVDMFIDDHTKQVSLSRVSVAAVLVLLLAYAGMQVWKTGTMPDLGEGWLTYLLGQYGLTKGASTFSGIKGTTNAS